MLEQLPSHLQSNIGNFRIKSQPWRPRFSCKCFHPGAHLYNEKAPTLTLDSTGITGYIAGDAFYALYQKHPEYEYSALVRTQAKADAVKKAYPAVKTVLGGLDDFETLKKAAAEADVVLRKHMGA